MEKLRMVEVTFLDHYSLGEEWYPLTEKHENCTLTCAGYLIDEDDLYYYVANTYEPKTKNYQAGTAILKSCVIGFQEYEQPSTRKPRKSGRFS